MATSEQSKAVDTDKVLERLVAGLRNAAGENLEGVALYGGLAKGRFTPGISDINVLVVLGDVSLGALEAIAPPLTAARRESRVAALVATAGDLGAMAQLFPVKLQDLKAAHRVLFGDVSLAALVTDAAAVRRRARQELMNLALRFRQRAVERGAEPAVLWHALAASLPKLAITLESLMRLDGGTLPADRPGVLRAAGRAFGVERQMERLSQIHRRDEPPDDAAIREAVAEFLHVVAALAERDGRE